MIWLRSLLFQLYFFASIAVAGVLIFLSAPLPHSWRFSIVRTWARTMLFVGRIVCGLEYVIEGRENIPQIPSVIMIKHSTVFEAYAQMAVFPRQTWVCKRELFLIPFVGWGLAAMKPIAINRGAGGSAVRQVIRKGKARLAEGIWVTVFPEGTRVPPGETRRYGLSGAALAKEAQCPIVPVAHNAGDLWARRGLKKNPGLIRFCIGPPIMPSDRSAKETNALVQDWIESRMVEISVGRPD
jgi:1-acyl-sn-glycerol-3-phosphate acyltransferase